MKKIPITILFSLIALAGFSQKPYDGIWICDPSESINSIIQIDERGVTLASRFDPANSDDLLRLVPVRYGTISDFGDCIFYMNSSTQSFLYLATYQEGTLIAYHSNGKSVKYIKVNQTYLNTTEIHDLMHPTEDHSLAGKAPKPKIEDYCNCNLKE